MGFRYETAANNAAFVLDTRLERVAAAQPFYERSMEGGGAEAPLRLGDYVYYGLIDDHHHDHHGHGNSDGHSDGHSGGGGGGGGRGQDRWAREEAAFARALELYRVASDRGSAQGSFNVGMMYAAQSDQRGVAFAPSLR